MAGRWLIAVFIAFGTGLGLVLATAFLCTASTSIRSCGSVSAQTPILHASPKRASACTTELCPAQSSGMPVALFAARAFIGFRCAWNLGALCGNHCGRMPAAVRITLTLEQFLTRMRTLRVQGLK